MEQKRTNIFFSSSSGETIINDFEDENCLFCISQNSKKGKGLIDCSIHNCKKRIYIRSSKSGNLYVCDDKEKSYKNFISLVELIYHSAKNLLEKYKQIKCSARESARNEIDIFKHNIEHINSDAINEFYSFIPQETFVKNFRKLQELVRNELQNNKDAAVDLITRLARYNLNIKTELSIISKLYNIGSSPNFSKANPRDAIMTNIYMLYPDFKNKHVYVDVDEFWDWLEIDFEALQVASYYIIENASKYTSEKSKLRVSFSYPDNETLNIVFSMNSLYINEAERPLIFDEGFKGEQAIKTGRSGKGIGLYRAKRLIIYCHGEFIINAGEEKFQKDGFSYADNIFIIRLPKYPSIIKR